MFSGFVIACRLATWPTRRSPVLLIATTDGVMRPPSALGMTTGSPPSITATTQFVVPRSMPITLRHVSYVASLDDALRLVRERFGTRLLCCSCGSSSPANDDHRRADYATAKPVPALRLGNHLAGFALLLGDRFMHVWIELLALGRDLRDPRGRKRALELPQYLTDALDPHAVLERRIDMLQCTFQIVDGG